MFGSIRLDWSVDDLFIKTKINNNFKDNIAIFTSRPDRNLNLLVDIWRKYIFTKKKVGLRKTWFGGQALIGGVGVSSAALVALDGFGGSRALPSLVRALANDAANDASTLASVSLNPIRYLGTMDMRKTSARATSPAATARQRIAASDGC